MCNEEHIAQSAQEIAQAVKLPGLKAEGIFTHFSDSDGSEEYTMLQFGRFLDIIDRVKALGYTFAIRHCANSAATLLYPATYLDMIRPGIVLYGHFPDMNMDPGLCDLVPVLELKSRVATVRQVPLEPLSAMAAPTPCSGIPPGGHPHRLWRRLLPWLLQPDHCPSERPEGPRHWPDLHGYVHGGRH